jgi:hypothetical protein
MNLDDMPLSVFEVDCDGSACGSGRDAGNHIHPAQSHATAIARVVVRDNERIRYEAAQGITRLTAT